MKRKNKKGIPLNTKENVAIVAKAVVSSMSKDQKDNFIRDHLSSLMYTMPTVIYGFYKEYFMED